MDVTTFLLPRSRYRGQVKPQNLVFNANLQEFSHRISYISSLETNGKLSPVDAYQQINELWQELSRSYQQLAIEQSPFEDHG